MIINIKIFIRSKKWDLKIPWIITDNSFALVFFSLEADRYTHMCLVLTGRHLIYKYKCTDLHHWNYNAILLFPKRLLPKPALGIFSWDKVELG